MNIHKELKALLNSVKSVDDLEKKLPLIMEKAKEQENYVQKQINNLK